ncbi:hypothetical protein HBZS_111800 [Helicobacter bizzozeronii CCUG 35545]|nr:hypothetical protein HBZS_111800 [Helicobacter bizzozeronii CCUG 35545]
MSAQNALIQVEGVYNAYGDRLIHRGVSFEVQKGEVLAILGGRWEREEHAFTQFDFA